MMKSTQHLVLNEWFTVQDCKGLPFFPGAEKNIRHNLEKMVEDAPGEITEKKRNKEKGKGVEYHISILPSHILSALSTHESSDRTTHRLNTPVDNLGIWLMIFNKLTIQQQQRAIDIFFEGGVNALMPEVIASTAAGNVTSKEILRRDSSTENTRPASQVSTHDKKVG